MAKSTIPIVRLSQNQEAAHGIAKAQMLDFTRLNFVCMIEY